MILYHGGIVAVPEPRIIRGDRIGDFGIGFYTTTDLEQARRFVHRKCSIEGVERGIVSRYAVPDDIFNRDGMSVRSFNGPTREWVDFVFENRRNSRYEHGFDLVFGPVANDQVYASLSLYEDGQIGTDELIRRLSSRKLVDQLLFHTEQAIGLLKFLGGEEVVCPAK